MIGSWLLCLAFSLGVFILYSREFALLSFFHVAGYLAVVLAFMRAARAWKDAFNPLCLILIGGFTRFCLPGILWMFGFGVHDPIFTVMNLQHEDWELGHVLALSSLLGIALGWSLLPARQKQLPQLKESYTRGVRDAALIGMVAGVAGLILYVGGNAPVLDIVLTGGLRGMTIQPGTGKYFYLGLMLIPGSIILSGYLLSTTRGLKWIALTPVLLTAVVFWVLGGRTRSMMPLLGGLLVLWYATRERRKWDRISFKLPLALLVVGIPFVVWVGYFGQLYRGGGGISAFQQSLSISALWQYFRWSIFVDIGHLYALAGAVRLKPAILEGSTFVWSLLWPFSQVLELGATSPGVAIMHFLGAFGPRRNWGLAPGLPGEAYMNFGPLGALVVMPVFGFVLKMLYSKLRRGKIHLAMYAILTVQVVNIYFGGIFVWVHLLVHLAWTVSILTFGEMLSGLRPRFKLKSDAPAPAADTP